MKVPLSWLSEFVDLTLTPEELAERMTFAGLELSEIIRIGDFWDKDKVMVGKILQVERHPNADRLTLVEVEYGEGRTIKLVTGAPNIKVGESGRKVPLALEGSRLVDGHSADGRIVTLEKAKIRGVVSAGMICSEMELGISEEHEGIMILPEDAPVGTPLADYLGEVVLDLDLTPNMSRCLSILGVAREVAALTDQKIKYRPAEAPEGTVKAADLMDIGIDVPDLCNRYCGTYIGGVSTGPSPFPIRWRLTMSGMRPINNIVDATNYVMLELGQPLHAFDYNSLKERAGGGKPEIIVRQAREGEKIRTLDGVDRICSADTLLITDRRGPIAVAGVMGGEETEVRPETTEILLEAANFNHASIRKTTQRFKLPSQASLRFGKGLPASLAMEAGRRVTGLMADLASGEAADGAVDCYPKNQEKVEVMINHHEFSRLLGYKLPEKRIFSILEGLGFSVSENQGFLNVQVPEHRLDVNIPADLVEEVARIEGYDKIPATLMKEYLPPQGHNPALELEEKVRDLLAASGLEEVINYSLSDEKCAARWMEMSEPAVLEGQDFLRLLNPLSEDRTVLRVSLVPEMLENLRANRRFQKRVAIFEIGRVFHPKRVRERPEEPRRLCILLWGQREAPWWGDPEPAVMNYFDLKGTITGLLNRMNAGEFRLEQSARECLRAGRGMELFIGDNLAGYMGELSREAMAGFDLGEEVVCVAEIDLGVLAGARSVPVLNAPSKFPAVVQDLALVVDDDLPAETLRDEIRRAGQDLLADVTVFDLYRGPQVPEGKKSIAFSLCFQAGDRTLTEEEASRRRDGILKAVGEKLGATLR